MDFALISGHDEIMGSINYVERSAMKLCFLILIDKFTFKKAMFCFPLSNIYLIMILWTEFGTKWKIIHSICIVVSPAS